MNDGAANLLVGCNPASFLERRLWIVSGRQSCLEIDLFSGNGVVEFQKVGVQEISSIAGEAGEIFKRLAG